MDNVTKLALRVYNIATGSEGDSLSVTPVDGPKMIQIHWVKVSQSRSGQCEEFALLCTNCKSLSVRQITNVHTPGDPLDRVYLAHYLLGTLKDKSQSDLWVLQLRREFRDDAIHKLTQLAEHLSTHLGRVIEFRVTRTLY